MKANQLGTKIEKMAEAILRKWGYETYRPPKSRFNRRKEDGGADAFGADIIAKQLGKPWYFVQTSVPSHLSHKKRQLDVGIRHLLDDTAVAEVWVWGEVKRPAIGEVFSTWRLEEDGGWRKGLWVQQDGKVVRG